MNDLTFTAFRVEEDNSAEPPRYNGRVCERRISELPEGELLIRVRYSSLNYKDALSARGNKGVTRNYPHTPGIDAAGEVIESASADFAVGDQVLVTGYDLGMNTAGGFAQYIRIPAAWAISLPAAMTLRQSMVLGTAGLTAALCVDKLLRNGLSPEQGTVLVSGASGGVGSLAVALLAQRGFDVSAVSGKPEAEAFLRELGATQVLARESFTEAQSKPMLKPQWAGAVDVVGGELLVNIIKSLHYGASVACCGLVGSPGLNATVLPFILRGVNLLGVDSVALPREQKIAIWQRLAGDWQLPQLESLATEIGFAELPEALERLFRGQSQGRLLLNTDR